MGTTRIDNIFSNSESILNLVYLVNRRRNKFVEDHKKFPKEIYFGKNIFIKLKEFLKIHNLTLTELESYLKMDIKVINKDNEILLK